MPELDPRVRCHPARHGQSRSCKNLHLLSDIHGLACTQVWLIPEELSYEEAAPMGGIALSTAVQALYHRLHLPPPWAPAADPFPVCS